MKCRSVACIWSGSPPPHRVTATAVLHRPPTLYTGAADGSIIWWTLSGGDIDPEIRSIAMLCGHAAPIVDLGICYPVANYGDGTLNSFSHLADNSKTLDHGALMSVCTDGVMCVWSRGSGHCRRRRKLPPWVGNPSIVCTLPSNPRYVLIACCFVDVVALSEHHSVDPSEGLEAVESEESQHKKPPKCSLVIVDSYTLSVVQTVFHGNLSIGPLKFMSIVTSSEDREKQSVIMFDTFGKAQLVPISKESNIDAVGRTALNTNSSHLEVPIWADKAREWGKIASLATCELFFAFIYKSCCIFRLAENGSEIGTINFADSFLVLEEGSSQPDAIKGMFLEDDAASSTHATKLFLLWNYWGSAISYSISYIEGIFKFEPLYVIPAMRAISDVRLSVTFMKLNSLILRVESICFHVEESLLWKPHISIWLPELQSDEHLKLGQQCRMLGQSGLYVSGAVTSTSFPQNVDPMHDAVVESTNKKIEFTQSCVSESENVENISADNNNCKKEWPVSSSMIISEGYGIPYAVIYGFYSGEIELIQLDLSFPGLNPGTASPCSELVPDLSRRLFCGHTGAVLCLAAHRMVGMCKGWSFSRVLVSGSMDCTVRIWDLDTDNPIIVLHQHVAPVRQIILPPSKTQYPWSDCFLSVGDDSCVALTSLQTLRVERMFPGHPNYPAKVVWDGPRGYLACICRKFSGASDAVDVLYIWDIKTGARERILRGAAAHSMFDHFYRSIGINSTTDILLNGNTSASLLILPIEDANTKNAEKGATLFSTVPCLTSITESNSIFHANCHPIKSSCPFPGIATLSFDLELLMSFYQKHDTVTTAGFRSDCSHFKEQRTQSPRDKVNHDGSDLDNVSSDAIEEHEWLRSLEECLLRFSLSFLHLWNVDLPLDKLLMTEMKLKRPDEFIIASGLQGDRGSLTVTFPGSAATLELWKSSSEFCAMRSLTMVSLAQRMIILCQTSSTASSALAAFYTRSFAEKIPDIKPPSLQLLVSFWQDKSEHVRMAARSIFHCAASRAIPLPLRNPKAFQHGRLLSFTNREVECDGQKCNKEDTSLKMLDPDRIPESEAVLEDEESNMLSWLESFEERDWISCVGGTTQDAMTSHIVVAAALAIWYPSIVKPSLSKLSVHPLMKLVMAMNEKYSSTAAELLAEGMESTWKAVIISEIPHLIGDIFFQIECVSGATKNSASKNLVAPDTIRDTLAGILLPSLAMADIPGFLSVVERQIWSTASDSPVHLVSLKTLVRVARGSPKSMAQYLDKVINFILQTMDPGNAVMRRTCFQSALATLKEMVRVFPMVALNDGSTRLAIGDVIGEIKTASIRVYDMQSVTKIKVLDASGPPGLPNLLAGAAETVITTMISALSFSPDGEGLVAFSEQGLMIRWWSLGSVWWEKLSRNFVPVQCTKLIFVPPWDGFSPNSSRSSIMESIMGHDKQANLQKFGDSINVENLKVLIQNLDLSYRLEWLGNKKVLLTRHGSELGTFQL